MKALGYEALLSQDEGTLTSAYPHGAVKTSGGKWVPSEIASTFRGVEAGDHQSLKELLADKEKRRRAVDPVRNLPADSTRPPVSDTYAALGARTARAFTKDGRRLEPEPERVNEEGEAKIKADSEARFNAEHVDEAVDMGAKVVANRIAKVQREGMRYGLDLGPKLQALIREHQQEINQLRKAA